MRGQWLTVAACLAATTAAGCSGDQETRGTYNADDARRLATIAPVTPGWPPWPKQARSDDSSSEATKEQQARDPIYDAFRRRTERIEQPDDWSAGNHWQDGDKLANLVVGVFDSAADAHAVFVAGNDLARAYATKYGFVARAEKVDGLGDEAWRLWAHGNGRQVTYHWRRENLLVEAHVHCYGECSADTDADVDAAVRAWADAIEQDARSHPR